ncbi:M48 family metallopeptidase [Streptomyces hokutonensis]|uniref:M48 family metallopeptidase n=1 Tax=Streptomyces hokutonensis TaxID=1306990 RepID=UPI00382D53E6
MWTFPLAPAGARQAGHRCGHADVGHPDPFGLPDGVRFRFVLLVTALFGTSAFICNLLYYTIHPSAADHYRDCVVKADVAPGAAPGSYTKEFLACTAPGREEQTLWVLAGLALLALTTAVVHLVLPWLRTRWQRLTPLRPDIDPGEAALSKVLESLVAQAELRVKPRFYVAPNRKEAGALAFGRLGDYRVRLNDGLIDKGAEDPEHLRTVVLHELAHIRNRDIDITYLTVALTLSFVPLGLIPLAVVLAGAGAESALDVGWRAVVLVSLVCLTAAAVLRVRETAADVRAASWSGARAGLLRLLTAPPPPGQRRSLWLRGPLRLHPRGWQRAAQVRCPAGLFRLGFTECLAVGLSATVAVSSLNTLLLTAFIGPDTRTVPWAVALVLAPLVVAVTGAGMWRAAAWARGRGPEAADGIRPPTVLAAIGLTVGLVVGRYIEADNGIGGRGALFPSRAAAVWSFVLGVLLVLFFRWMAQGAAVWLDPLGRPLSRAWPVAWVAAVVPLAVLLAWWLLLYDMSDGLQVINEGLVADHRAAMAVAPAGPLWAWAALNYPMALLFYRWTPAVLAAAALWALPLAVLWRRGASAPSSGWARRVVMSALGGTAVFTVVVVGARLAAHFGVPAELRGSPGYAGVFEHWLVSSAVLLQGVVAAFVTARLHHAHGRPAVLFGLMAAFMTGCLATTVFLGSAVAGGCWDVLALASGPCGANLNPSAVRDSLLRTVVAGAATAVVGAGTAATLRSWWTRRRHAPARVHTGLAPVSRRQRAVLAAAGALALAVVLTGLTVDTSAGRPEVASRGAAARACQKLDEVMGSGDRMTGADKTAGLFEAVGLAEDGHNSALATALKDFVRAAQRQDLPAFVDAGERIRAQCVTEGSPLRAF